MTTLTRFVVQLVRCLFLPKGQTLVFNHSARARRTADRCRSLYLSPRVDLQNCIVAEYALDAPEHGSRPVRIDARLVDRAGEIVGAVAYRLARVFGAPADLFISRFYAGTITWKWTLGLLRVSGVKTFVWYGHLSTLAAAAELGIESCDLQHGIIYGSHAFYRPPSVGSEGEGRYLTPDCFWVYGEYWRQKLIASGWPEHAVMVGGYGVDVEPALQWSPQRPYLLYTSQPGYGPIIREHVASILDEVIALGWEVVIAPHPSEHASSYDDMLSNHVRILKLDSYDLLRSCAVHLSVSSTLLWEAMLFGKSSYVIVSPFNAQIVEDLLSLGFARLAGAGDFPTPFELPAEPPVRYFFDLEPAPLGQGTVV